MAKLQDTMKFKTVDEHFMNQIDRAQYEGLLKSLYGNLNRESCIYCI